MIIWFFGEDFSFFFVKKKKKDKLLKYYLYDDFGIKVYYINEMVELWFFGGKIFWYIILVFIRNWKDIGIFFILWFDIMGNVFSLR